MVLLAAKQASPGSAAGIFFAGKGLQCLPPSLVCRKKNLPFNGSLTAMPRRSFQNAMPSKKMSLLVLVYTSFHVAPPSAVIRICAGEPALRITAFLSLKATRERKSAFSKPFTDCHCQLSPLLMDFPTVPLLPLTQITWSFTTLIPRRLVG